jgi:hypothetical protein
MADPADPPLLLVKGDASAEEVAALVAVLQLVSAARAAEESDRLGGRRAASEWAAPRRLVRGPRTAPAAGPGGWRASGLPQ